MKIIIVNISIILLIGCVIAVSAYAGKANAEVKSEKIDLIKLIMADERDTDSAIQYQGIVDEDAAYIGKSALFDDRFEYILDPDGYILSATRTKDKSVDLYNSTSSIQDDLETRALNLHQRNLEKWLKGEYSITKNDNPMGVTTIEITEIQSGNPTGRKTYVKFSSGGALISFISLNKPVPESDLTQQVNISKEKAAEIAFADLQKQYGKVLEEKDFAKVQWTAIKETFNQRLVWTITFSTLTRSDSRIPGKGWGAMIRVDILTGDILERAYQS